MEEKGIRGGEGEECLVQHRGRKKRLSVATDSVRDSTKEKRTKKLVHIICYVWTEFENLVCDRFA